jgi:hypothetical protein
MENYVIEFGYLDTDAPSINYLFNIGENVFNLMFEENNWLVKRQDLITDIKKIKDYMKKDYRHNTIGYIMIYKTTINKELFDAIEISNYNDDIGAIKGEMISLELIKVEK